MKLNSAFPFSAPRPVDPAPVSESTPHRREIVAHLRECRAELCGEFADRLLHARWLDGLKTEEIHREASAIYDEYVDALETGKIEALQDCSIHVSDRLLASGVDFERILGVVRFLRYLVMRSLFDRFHQAVNRGEGTVSESAALSHAGLG